MILQSQRPLCMTLCALAALVVSACGGSVSPGPEAAETGGSAGAAGGAGSAGTAGIAGTGGSGNAPGCESNGQWYPVGASFKLDCNTCYCLASGQLSCTAMACFACYWNEQGYVAGQTWEAGDGCNTCTCQSNGSVMCTNMACAGCVYAGMTYKPGDSFPSLDGCNECTCTDQGISCTEKACPCDPEKEWWREYVADSPEECAVIDYACPQNTKYFGNACGCGCEQDESCPPYINCMPPAPNCESDKEKCPYSDVAL